MDGALNEEKMLKGLKYRPCVQREGWSPLPWGRVGWDGVGWGGWGGSWCLMEPCQAVTWQKVSGSQKCQKVPQFSHQELVRERNRSAKFYYDSERSGSVLVWGREGNE